MAIGLQTQTYVERRFIHTSVFLDYANLRWFTRTPAPIVSYSNIAKAFDLGVWMSLLITLFIFSMLFFAIYHIYLDIDFTLVGKGNEMKF